MTINCNGTLVDLTTPKVMGILNITPDSFYDGGKHTHKNTIIAQVDKMLTAGATFIDVGGYSSRPGATFVSIDEELKRILPIISLLKKEFPDILLSIDTFRSEVAEKCIGLGAAIINDISAGSLDKQMFFIISKLKVPYIMMHMRGNPQTMQQQVVYKNLLEDIIYYFSEKLAALRSLGISDIVIDPGFGFSKSMEQNYELLQKLAAFQT